MSDDLGHHVQDGKMGIDVIPCEGDDLVMVAMERGAERCDVYLTPAQVSLLVDYLVRALAHLIPPPQSKRGGGVVS